MSALSKIEAVFIDRDGTIGGSDQVIYPGEFELFPFISRSFDKLKQAGVPIYSFTNQPGVSRGEASIIDFQNELHSFGFDKIYICPHPPEASCSCRKPAPGMLITAARENNLNLNNCVVIGDRWTDMIAAKRAGSIRILVETGSGKRDLAKFRASLFFGEWLEAAPDYIAEDISDAISWLLS